MSCSTPNMTTKDANDDVRSNSFFENVTTPDDQQTNSSLKSLTNDNLSESVRLFKKYLLAKNQNNMGTKTNWEVDRKSEFHLNTFRRRPSLLEQALLPRLRSCGEVESTLSNDKTTQQLTIFHDGVINVYDNIPADKAQAVMRLASESSSLKPVVAESSKPDLRKPPHHKSKLLSVSKLKAGIPMARRYSLQSFHEKRRDMRIISKSPYTFPSEKQEEDKGKGSNEGNRKLVPDLSPFPSRLGNFSRSQGIN